MISNLHNVTYPAGGLVSSGALAYKLMDLRKDRGNPVLRSLCLTLACAALGFVAATPAVYLPISTALDLNNLGKLAVHGSLIAFSVCVQRLLLVWSYPPESARPKARRRAMAGSILLLAMIVLLALAPVHDGTAAHFTETYAATPYIAEYLLLYVTGVGVGLAEIAILCWRFAKVAGRPWLVRGLRLTAVGAAIALGYCVIKGLYVIGRNVGFSLGTLSELDSAFAAVGGAMVCIGLVLPALGPRLSAAARWLGHFRAYHQIFPLWLAAYEAMPDVALDPPSRPRLARWRPGQLHYRLYRMVIEIRDARHGLREHLDQDLAAAAGALAQQAGATSDQQNAAAEAAMLREALGTARNVGAQQHASAAAQPLPPLGGKDYPGELAWFLKVAQAFNRRPPRSGRRPRLSRLNRSGAHE
ncbi:MAB_1171c family putative transporter [Streptomyces sp. GbtcB6]|uniref:MAB_1171c family putative transporter n=1 Tax=Streptomyces sp. GbtcB6 TaxID=2824751 RepID=UPI001C2F144D|nr:MAB_1171c family putative transporter [Streptomyces sp. GbtcB6]